MADLLTRIQRAARPKQAKGLYELHPELADRVSILRTSSDGQPVYSPFSGVQSNAAYYEFHSWTRKAIRVLSENTKSLPRRVVIGDGLDAKVIEKHAITQLLAFPNPRMDSSHFWEEWMINLMLAGEHAAELVMNSAGTEILEMWPRAPQDFSVRAAALGSRYREVMAYRVDDGQGRPYDLKPTELVHWKFYNPRNIWRGISPIAAIRHSIQIDVLAQAWSRSFFSNSARPDFALIAPAGMTQDEREGYEARLSEEHGGPSQAHRPIVLEQGVTDIKHLNWAPKDMEWLTQREVSRDEVGSIFGVPDEIMGYGRDTYENFQSAYEILWRVTLVPLMNFCDSVLTHHFRSLGALKGDERVQADLSEVSALQEDFTGKVEQYTKLVSNGVPPNAAIKMVGLPLDPIKGGDVGYMPFSMSPITELAGSRELGASGRTKHPAKSAIPAYGSKEHKELLARKSARLEKVTEEMQRGLKRYFQEQQNRVSAALRQERSLGRGKHKGKDNIPPPEGIFNLLEEIRRFIETFKPVLMEAFGLVGAAEVGDLGIEVSFDVERPEAQAAVTHVLDTMARRTNESTWRDLVDIFQEAESAGEGLPAVMERLSAYYGDRKSDYQTERIARTTLTATGNAAAQEAYSQSEVVKGKGWISALLPSTRDAHAEAHGQVVGLREMFLVFGEYLLHPGDPNGSAKNIVNCLCTMIPIVE